MKGPGLKGKRAEYGARFFPNPNRANGTEAKHLDRRRKLLNHCEDLWCMIRRRAMFGLILHGRR